MRRGRVSHLTALFCLIVCGLACQEHRDSPILAPAVADLSFRRGAGGQFLANGAHHFARVAETGEFELRLTTGGPSPAISFQTAGITERTLTPIGEELRRRGTAFVEVIRNRLEGVEQSWEFPELPPNGAVRVEVEVKHARHVATTDLGIHLSASGSAQMLRYGHATWVSAEGSRWPVTGRFAADRIVFEVPPEILERTRFPAVLDPLISPEFDTDQPTFTSSPDNPRFPAVAHGAGFHVVVWTALRSTSSPVVAARVRSDGFVLDAQPIVVSDHLGIHSEEASVVFEYFGFT